MLIDTHVHLDSYSDDEIAGVLQRGREVNVKALISAGTTVESSARCVQLSDKFPDVFSGVGVHPMDLINPLDEEDYDVLKRLINSNNKVIVMSEIGLDYLDGMPNREWQFSAFRNQIGIAREFNLPIVFHSRESNEDCFRVLKEEKAYEVGGVMHYFQGTREDAQKAIDMGFYISIARPIFKLKHLRNILTDIPVNNLVVETDSAPQPFKAKRENWTEPRHLRSIVREIATLKDLEEAYVEREILNNMKALLKDKWDIVLPLLDSEA